MKPTFAYITLTFDTPEEMEDAFNKLIENHGKSSVTINGLVINGSMNISATTFQKGPAIKLVVAEEEFEKKELAKLNRF